MTTSRDADHSPVQRTDRTRAIDDYSYKSWTILEFSIVYESFMIFIKGEKKVQREYLVTYLKMQSKTIMKG